MSGTANPNVATVGGRAGTPRVLFTGKQIADRVKEIASEISSFAGEDEPPVLVGMLKGSLIFLADLIRHLGSAQIEFLAISSFASASAGVSTGPPGRVRIEKDLDIDISGRRVLVVEDVVDTGFTLSYLMENLRMRVPASLDVVTLLDKRARRIIDVPIAYAGFEIADEFVLGYGLDFAQRYRNVPFIFAADDLDGLIADPDFYMAGALALM